MYLFSAGHFLHIDHCRTKCPAVLDLSVEHFIIVPDMSGIFGDHCHSLPNTLTLVITTLYTIKCEFK